MTSERASARDLIYSALFAFLILLVGGGMAAYILSDPQLRPVLTAMRTLAALERSYPGELDWPAMTNDGINAMIDRLDRFSGYMQPGDVSRRDEELTGAYGGIGISVSDDPRGLLILSIREGGPAARAGMLIGDVIIQADSASLGGKLSTDAVGLLRGAEGTSVAVTYIRRARPDSAVDTIRATLLRESIRLQHLAYAGYTVDSVIYIRLLGFDAGAADAIRSALDSLMPRGAAPAGLVLDLRGNPGGLLYEARKVAELFLPEGELIVGTKGRIPWLDEQLRSSKDDLLAGKPMVVLVDRSSASASEIVAGALKQLNRATLVGDTTFGKGLVQGFSRFEDGSALRLTQSRYYVAGELFLNRFDSSLNDSGTGIAPHHYRQFHERDPFIRALEGSNLLTRFAIAHEEAIISPGAQFSPDGRWLDSVDLFLRKSGFAHSSHSTLVSELLMHLAANEEASPAIREESRRLDSLADAIDRNAVRLSGDYVLMRIRQLAFERRFGATRAFEEIVVRSHPDILSAASLVTKQQ